MSRVVVAWTVHKGKIGARVLGEVDGRSSCLSNVDGGCFNATKPKFQGKLVVHLKM